jgi:hypothetical protein
MKFAVRGLGLAASLALVSTAPVVTPAKAQSMPPAAYVYVQISSLQGSVYGFSSSSTGKLTPIQGAPWKPAGSIIGSNKSQFFTLGQDLIHSYGIASDGAIESQLAQMPILDYAGSSCNDGLQGDNGAVLDHTGKYIYVKLEDNDGVCAAYQSYKINSDGAFAFDGDTELNWNGNGESAGLPSILGNESFAYSDYDYLNSGPVVTGFRSETSGTLELMQFQENYPALSDDYYVTGGPDASPAGNYLVLQLWPADGGPTQLASYTVDSEGSISTTNTSSNMPTSALTNPQSTFSPSGNLFVLYAGANNTPSAGDGIEIYNFNGAAPLTLNTKLMPETPINQVAWDSSNHMYAISWFENRLYVFTVTPTSITGDTVWDIGGPVKMVLVSK